MTTILFFKFREEKNKSIGGKFTEILPKSIHSQREEELHWHSAQLIAFIKCKHVKNIIKNLTGEDFDEISTKSDYSSTQSWEVGWQRNEYQIQGTSHPVEQLSKIYWHGYDEIAVLSVPSLCNKEKGNSDDVADNDSLLLNQNIVNAHSLIFANCNLIEVISFCCCFTYPLKMRDRIK
jgi:hypothetical protein